MNNDTWFYVDENGKYLGTMSGELLPGSPHPYPTGIEVPVPPNSMMDSWDFENKVWVPAVEELT